MPGNVVKNLKNGLKKEISPIRQNNFFCNKSANITTALIKIPLLGY
jgi:hypothetical protein